MPTSRDDEGAKTRRGAAFALLALGFLVVVLAGSASADAVVAPVADDAAAAPASTVPASPPTTVATPPPTTVAAAPAQPATSPTTVASTAPAPAATEAPSSTPGTAGQGSTVSLKTSSSTPEASVAGRVSTSTSTGNSGSPVPLPSGIADAPTTANAGVPRAASNTPGEVSTSAETAAGPAQTEITRGVLAATTAARTSGLDTEEAAVLAALEMVAKTGGSNTSFDRTEGCRGGLFDSFSIASGGCDATPAAPVPGPAGSATGIALAIGSAATCVATGTSKRTGSCTPLGIGGSAPGSALAAPGGSALVSYNTVLTLKANGIAIGGEGRAGTDGSADVSFGTANAALTNTNTSLPTTAFAGPSNTSPSIGTRSAFSWASASERTAKSVGKPPLFGALMLLVSRRRSRPAGNGQPAPTSPAFPDGAPVAAAVMPPVERALPAPLEPSSPVSQDALAHRGPRRRRRRCRAPGHWPPSHWPPGQPHRSRSGWTAARNTTGRAKRTTR